MVESIVLLKEIANILNGYAFKSSEYQNKGHRVIRITNVQKGFLIDDDPKFYNSSENLKKYELKENDILISLTGNVGRVGLVTKNILPAYLNQRVGCIRIKEDLVDNNFLFHFLNNDCFENDCINNSKGIAQLNLSTEWLKDVEIKLPSLENQKKIAKILDKADEIRTKKKQANEKLDEFLKSTFADMFGDPIKNDKNWNQYKMEKLMTIKRGGSPRPIEKYLGGEYHWIKIGDATKASSIYICNTKEKIIKEGLKKTTFLKSGSLIFANCGVSLGFARILKIDGCIHDGWLSFSDINENLNKIFLLKTLNHITEYFRKIAPDGTQPNLNTTIMKNFEVILPPIEEQNKFARIVEKVEEQKQKNEKVIEQMDNLFNSLSQRAFKGEL